MQRVYYSTFKKHFLWIELIRIKLLLMGKTFSLYFANLIFHPLANCYFYVLSCTFFFVLFFISIFTLCFFVELSMAVVISIWFTLNLPLECTRTQRQTPRKFTTNEKFKITFNRKQLSNENENQITFIARTFTFRYISHWRMVEFIFLLFYVIIFYHNERRASCVCVRACSVWTTIFRQFATYISVYYTHLSRLQRNGIIVYNIFIYIHVESKQASDRTRDVYTVHSIKWHIVLC